MQDHLCGGWEITFVNDESWEITFVIDKRSHLWMMRDHLCEVWKIIFVNDKRSPLKYERWSLWMMRYHLCELWDHICKWWEINFVNYERSPLWSMIDHICEGWEILKQPFWQQVCYLSRTKLFITYTMKYNPTNKWFLVTVKAVTRVWNFSSGEFSRMIFIL